MYAIRSYYEISTPQLPVVNNVDVAVCDQPELIRDALIRHVITSYSIHYTKLYDGRAM